MNELWEKKAVERVDVLIDRLLKAKSGANSWPVTFHTILNFLALRGCAKPDKLTQGIIMKVLANEKGLSEPYHESFEISYQDFEVMKRTQKRFSWTSYIPLKIEFPNDCRIKQITIGGLTFRLITLNTVRQRIGNKRFDDIVKQISLSTEYVPRRLPHNWLFCETNNINFQESWYEIAPPLQSLRGLLELAVSGFSFKHSCPFQPRFSLPFPSFVIGLSDAKKLDHYYFRKLHDEKKEKPLKIKESHIEWAKEQARLLRGPFQDNSIELLIANCLRLFSSSVDDIHSKNCLLSLWQMAESLTLSESYGGQTGIVVERLSWFSRDLRGVDKQTLRDALTVIAYNRNQIVHSGRDKRMDDDYLFMLQITCVVALLWILKNIQSFKTINDLELYYQCYTKNDAEIQRLENVIKMIKKKRK